MFHRPRTLRLCLSTLFVAALAACGGGGGDSSSATGTTPVITGASAGSAVSASNYQSFEVPLGAAVGGFSAGSSVGGDIGVTGASGHAASVTGKALASVLASVGRHTASIMSARPAATSSDTESCGYAGTITVTVNDADNSGTASVGDTVTGTLTNCQDIASDSAVNGAFTMTLTLLQLNSSDVGMVAVSGSFTNLTQDGFALNGSLALTISLNADQSFSLQAQLNGDLLSWNGGSETLTGTLSDSVTAAGSETWSMNGTLGYAGQTYVMSQVNAFTDNGGDVPLGGDVELLDISGNAVLLHARSDSLVDFYFYPVGATAPSATTTGVAWSSIGG